MAAPNKQSFRDAILRTDFPSFIQKSFTELNSGATYLRNWHIDAIAHQLELARTGANPRLIITMPPRSLKSICTSVAWPAYLLGHNPALRLLCVSYSTELAAKHASDFRRIVNSAWYRQLFPATRPAKDIDTEFETTKNGGRLAVSIGGSITGRGGDFIIIDDPLKAEGALWRLTREKTNDFFATTLYPRLDSKADGVIVLVMQRLHKEDLAGILLKQGGWSHLNLPAIATHDERIALPNRKFLERKEGDLLHPRREPRAVLEQIKETLGSLHFQAQYQQSPVAETGNLIKLDWFRYDPPPARSSSTRIIQSWDTALKGDPTSNFSVCTTWLEHKGIHYLLDVTRRQCAYPELLTLAVDLYSRHQPDMVLVEDHGSGSILIADLRHRHQIYAIPIRPEGDKISRFGGASLSIEAGTVCLPDRAPWLGLFLDELLTFPQARFDDQADSVSQYLNWYRARTWTKKFEYEFMW
jgi:predicted phage terminase large subunit-like protein